MSEAQIAETTSQQPPSAPPPEAVDPPAIGGKSNGNVSPPSEQQAEQKADTTQQSEPVDWATDWRAHLAADNPDALKVLSRSKTPQDMVQRLVEQSKELSKRAVSGEFPADADEETQQQWRDHHGVPAEGTLKAYEIKTPEGYDLSEVEAGMLDEFVKEMHGENAPKALMQKTVDKWFQKNAANAQAIRALDEERSNEWMQQTQKELGKDYEPMLSAANAYFEQRIPDKTARAEFLSARLPGGGLLANHPEFVKMAADLALQNGYGDRIEANSMESGGKSLAEQHHEISKLLDTDPARYNLPATQAQLDKIIGLRFARGEIDEFGREKK